MSPVIQPDFSEALDLSPIEPGTYPAKVIHFKPGVSKKGNPQLEGDVELVVDRKTRGRKVWWNTTGKGSGSLQQYLRAIGRVDLTAPGSSFDPDEIINVEFLAIVDSTEFEGQTRDQIVNCLKA